MKREQMKDIDDFLADQLECKRALAVKMDRYGYSHELIANLLQVSLPFIRKWKSLYRKHGSPCFALQYKGSQSFLSAAEQHELITFLKTKDYYSVEDLRDYVEAHYQVVYRSKQSYYNLLHAAHISWKKNTIRNPKHNAEQVATRRQEINALLASRKAEIESGQLVVLLEDECHLLWGDTIGYIWGRTNERILVPIKNIRERQTYYGAIDLVNHAFHVCPFPKGDSVYTVKFVHYLHDQYPDAKLLLIWDGAKYHQYAEMQTYLQEINNGLSPHDWKVTCELLAPNAPEQNPVEDIWLRGKNFLRKHFYKHKTFAQVKAAFLKFLQTTRFDFPKLSLYSYV